MRIAIIGSEHPLGAVSAGAGTYAYETSRMLARYGHSVEVFARADGSGRTESHDGVMVRLIQSTPESFADEAGEAFAQRHSRSPFDVLEGPDLHADAAVALEKAPGVPFVTRLHTPFSLLKRLRGKQPMGPVRRVRTVLGAWRRGRPPHWVTPLDEDRERLCVLNSDEIAAPSRAIANELVGRWGLPPALVHVIPNSYDPHPDLIGMDYRPTGTTVLTVGRVDTLKGVEEVALAARALVSRYPSIRFRFAGRVVRDINGTQMDDKLRRLAGPAADRLHFDGQVATRDLPSLFRAARVCLFPSHWDCFPYACLEAMAAGRPVIGSTAGGMVEMLARGECGLLVPPRRPRKLAAAIAYLLDNPGTASELAFAGRHRVLTEYGPERVAPLQLQSYERAIGRRRILGPRR